MTSRDSAELDARLATIRAALTPAGREQHDRNRASLQAAIDDFNRTFRLLKPAHHEGDAG